jgi:hypothetical protein
VPTPEIHEKERQVVEDVGASDLIVELDAVEQRRAAIEQDDVAKVKVAVALADESRVAPAVQQCAMPVERAASLARYAGADG